MTDKSYKVGLWLAAICLVLGMINLSLSRENEPIVFYQGERLDIEMDNQMVDATDFLARSEIVAALEGEKYPIEELCEKIGLDFTFDSRNNFYVLGDNATYTTQVPVLMYHHLIAAQDMWQRPKDDITLTVEEFTAQMDYLKDNGWQTIGLDDLAQFVRGDRLLNPKSVVITFDDGFLSNYTYAYPILKERGLKAVLFVLSDYLVESEKEFQPNLMQYLSSDDLLKMQDVFSYGSHTANLHALKRGQSALCLADEASIEADLRRSRKSLAGTVYLSYPYGEYNERVLTIARKCGFALCFAVGGHSVKMYDDPYTLGRIDACQYRELNEFQKLMESCAY